MKKSPRTTKRSKKTTAAAGGLLASAATMLLPKAVDANTITESNDFPNDFASRQPLANGVDGVQGTVNSGIGSEGGGPRDPADYFVFTGSNPGSAFTLQITFVESNTSSFFVPMTLEWRAEPGGAILNSTIVNSVNDVSSFNGIVPLNGNIAADVLMGGLSSGVIDTFRVDLSVQPAGVPDSGSTMMLMGAAVAGLSLAKKLRRRKKKA